MQIFTLRAAVYKPVSNIVRPNVQGLYHFATGLYKTAFLRAQSVSVLLPGG